MMLLRKYIYNRTSTSMSPMKINYENDNKNSNGQEEIEDLDIVSTQVDYHLDVNNIQLKYDNSIIWEDNGDDINNNNAATDDGENDSDSTIHTYLTKTTV